MTQSGELSYQTAKLVNNKERFFHHVEKEAGLVQKSVYPRPEYSNSALH